MGYEGASQPQVPAESAFGAYSLSEVAAGINPVDPDIWVVLTHAVGDNEQCLALAEALGRPFRSIYLDWPEARRVDDRRRLAALLRNDIGAQARRAALGLRAPWPRLVICCGRRAGVVAFWIKRESADGTKIVAIDRARRSLADYDLLIAPPQFLVPERANVIHLPMPLVRNRSAAQPGRPTGLIAVPKPWFTLLLGGRVKQFVTSEAALKRAAAFAQMAAEQYGGSVVVSTSRRTPPWLLAAVEGELTRPAIYRWSGPDAENPYATLLQESAALFVTADSASMIRDACRSGTPTYLIEFPERIDPRRLCRRIIYRQIRHLAQILCAFGLSGSADKVDEVQGWLHAKHILRYPRDLRRFHSKVYEMRLAQPAASFDPSAIAARRSVDCVVDASGLQTIVRRCLTLLGQGVSPEARGIQADGRSISRTPKTEEMAATGAAR